MIQKAILVLFFLTIAAMSETITGKVVKVADGDTVTILYKNEHSKKEIRVRLLAIDAPESKQAYGKKSKAYLSQLVFNKTVTVEWTKKDRYKRVLGVLFINGKNINQEMLKSGLAWHYRQYSKDKDLQAMEDKAKASKLGLWQDPKAIPPWDFRRKK